MRALIHILFQSSRNPCYTEPKSKFGLQQTVSLRALS